MPESKNIAEPQSIIIIPHLRVQNANLISGPLTWGFPAITAFCGAIHKLERDLELPGKIVGTGVICHAFMPQVSKSGYRYALNLKRHPVNAKGESASIIEEGRVHLEVSLVIAIDAMLTEFEGRNLAQTISEKLLSMRLAGGSVLPSNISTKGKQSEKYTARWLDWSCSQDEQLEFFKKNRRQFLPGFALTGREDLLLQQIEQLQSVNPKATALDALLSLTRINIKPKTTEQDNWAYEQKHGWLVPIAVGYAGISPLYEPGEVKNARDTSIPFRFVENIYSLGEWKSPHRLTNFQDFLWRYSVNPELSIYSCIPFNNYNH